MPDAVPMYKDEELTTKSQKNMNSDVLFADLRNVNSNISSTLIKATGSDEINVFAVGVGMQYHITMVIVSKSADQPIIFNGKEYTGINEHPIFFFVEDWGGARMYFTQEAFEAVMKDWVYSARRYYRKEQNNQNGQKAPKKDNILNTVIYKLKVDDTSTPSEPIPVTPPPTPAAPTSH